MVTQQDPSRASSSSSVHDTALSIITFIGCGLSAIGLLLTIVLHFGYLTLRRTVPSKILLQLCLALMAGLVLFVVAGRSGSASGSGSCQAIAILMQYFWLCALCWMVCEGLNLYAIIVVVLGLDLDHRLRNYTTMAWGRYHALIHSRNCILSGNNVSVTDC